MTSQNIVILEWRHKILRSYWYFEPDEFKRSTIYERRILQPLFTGSRSTMETLEEHVEQFKIDNKTPERRHWCADALTDNVINVSFWCFLVFSWLRRKYCQLCEEFTTCTIGKGLWFPPPLLRGPRLPKLKLKKIIFEVIMRHHKLCFHSVLTVHFAMS